MALINKVENYASVVYNGNTINSNSVETLLLLNPILLKAVDKLTAIIGETLTYSVQITNPGLSQITSIPFTDTIAEGAEYVDGSFTVNDNTVSPTVNGSTISYTIPSIAALGLATVQFQVQVVGGEV